MFEFINGKEFETGGDSLHVHSLRARNLARVLCFVLSDLLDTLVGNQQPEVKTSGADPCHIFLREGVTQGYAMRVRRERGSRKLPSHF